MSVEDAQAALAQLEELRPPDMERSEWYARMLVAAAAVRDKTMRWFWDAAAGEWVPAIEVYRVVVDGRPAVDVFAV
jgi:hypothetical protein